MKKNEKGTTFELKEISLATLLSQTLLGGFNVYIACMIML